MKMKNAWWIFLAFIYMILSIKSFSECQLNCGTLVRSTCTDDVTAKWNKIMVGKSLKRWMSSLTKIRSMPAQDVKLFFLRKKATDFDIKNKFGKPVGQGVQYISNRNCSTKKNVGPTWRKTSISSGTIFHDGFLYGREDEKGEFTGVMNCEFEALN